MSNATSNHQLSPGGRRQQTIQLGGPNRQFETPFANSLSRRVSIGSTDEVSDATEGWVRDRRDITVAISHEAISGRPVQEMPVPIRDHGESAFKQVSHDAVRSDGSVEFRRPFGHLASSSFKHPRSPDATERSNAEAFSIPAAPPVGTQVVPTEQPLESVYQHLVLDTMFQNRIVVNSQLLRTDPRAQQHIRHCLAAAPRMLFNDHRRGAHALLGWFRGVDAILSTALTLARVGAAEPKTLLAGESALWHCKLMAILEGLQAMISPLDQCIQKIRNSMQMVEEQHHSTAAAITPASSNNVNPSSRRVPATHERRPSFITPRDSLYLEVVLPALNNIRAKNAGTVPAQPGPQAIIRHLLASAPDFLTRDWNASPIYVTGWALGLHELIDAIRGMREQGGLSWDTVLSATTTLDYTIRLAQELRIEDQTLSHMFAGALAKLEALYDPDDRTKFMGVQVRN